MRTLLVLLAALWTPQPELSPPTLEQARNWPAVHEDTVSVSRHGPLLEGADMTVAVWLVRLPRPEHAATLPVQFYRYEVLCRPAAMRRRENLRVLPGETELGAGLAAPAAELQYLGHQTPEARTLFEAVCTE